jgi:hypothetical protein
LPDGWGRCDKLNWFPARNRWKSREISKNCTLSNLNPPRTDPAVRLERIIEQLTVAIGTIAGVAFAFWAARAAGSGDFTKLAAVGIGIVVILILNAMREHTPILIFFGLAFGGSIAVLPLPFSVKNITVFLALGMLFVLSAFKIVRRKGTFDLLDGVLWINVLYLVTVFLRNPVGTLAIESERVGGRPYFEVVAALIGYFVLQRYALPRGRPNLITQAAVVSGCAHGLLGALAFHFPDVGGVIQTVYTGVAVQSAAAIDNIANPLAEQGEARLGYMVDIGVPVITALVSYCRPITLLLPPYFGRFALFMTISILLFLSGFRSLFVTLGLYFVVATWFRGGIGDVLRVIAVGLCSVVLLIVAQGRLLELPLGVQRTLSFLPGKWNESVVADANHSVRWRQEMWDEILHGYRVMDNKVLGDGFGFLKTEFDGALSEMMWNQMASQRFFLMTGQVHSGPITCIRYVGYVGLVLFIAFLLIYAFHAYRTIIAARNTPFFSAALFLGVPAICLPFAYVVLFGSFDVSFPQAILALGCLRVLENSLRDWRLEQALKPLEDRKSGASVAPQGRGRDRRPLRSPRQYALPPMARPGSGRSPTPV